MKLLLLASMTETVYKVTTLNPEILKKIPGRVRVVKKRVRVG